MFGLFKKTLNLVAPISGKVIDLSEVPDETFSKRLVGNGVAIDSTGDLVVAPADGELALIFRTNHAFAIRTDDGIELLIHVGIDTVELEGEGFERIGVEGTKVKAGDPILKINRSIMEAKGLSLITPVLITLPMGVEDIDFPLNKTVECGKDIVLKYKYK